MRVDAGLAEIEMSAETDDEIELLGLITEAVRIGGYIQVKCKTGGATRLEFEGDPDHTEDDG